MLLLSFLRLVTVGTSDYGFTIPKEIVGKRIIIEGIEPAKLIRERKIVKKEYQKDIQFVANRYTGYLLKKYKISEVNFRTTEFFITLFHISLPGEITIESIYPRND